MSEVTGATTETDQVPHDSADLQVKDGGMETKDNDESCKPANSDLTETDVNDAYAYTKTSNFTSEVFKIEIGNLPKYFGYGEFKKLLMRKLKLKPHKVNVVSKINKAYVTFRNEEDKIEALEKLKTFVHKGKKFEVKNAKPKADAMAVKRTCDTQSDDNVSSKRKKEDENISTEEMLKNTVIPWWNKSYAQQLEDKHEKMCQSLTELRKRICAIDHLDVEVFRWLMTQKKDTGLCCPTKAILPSPVTSGYRNKCGFTVGRDGDGEVTVGFRLGKYRDQVCATAPPTCLVHVPEIMKQIADCFTRYVKQSTLVVYNKQDYKGYWKQLTVRTTRRNAAMATVTICKQDLQDERLVAEQQSILEFFKSNDIELDTLLFHAVPTHIRQNAVSSPPLVVSGEGVIFEELFDLKFQISPEAFFQCNTAAAEVLYNCIRDMVLRKVVNQTEFGEEQDIKDTVLLDICCGTGAIGLSLAKSVRRVIGVDVCQQAIEDAKMNAKLNNITNVHFYCSRAEDEIPNLMPSLSHSATNIVAVVDPPRCGLHQKVIKTIRQCSSIKKLVYVSCSVDQAKTNFIDLCRPASKRLSGLPFMPVLAQPIDLFPHTMHCEVVILFERIQPVPPQPVVDAEQSVKTNVPKPEVETKSETVAADFKDESTAIVSPANEGVLR